MAFSTLTKYKITLPTTKKTIRARIAGRYEFVSCATKPKTSGPIHEVPLSEIAYIPKNADSLPFGIICENSDRDNACDPPKTNPIAALMKYASAIVLMKP